MLSETIVVNSYFLGIIQDSIKNELSDDLLRIWSYNQKGKTYQFQNKLAWSNEKHRLDVIKSERYIVSVNVTLNNLKLALYRYMCKNNTSEVIVLLKSTIVDANDKGEYLVQAFIMTNTDTHFKPYDKNILKNYDGINVPSKDSFFWAAYKFHMGQNPLPSPVVSDKSSSDTVANDSRDLMYSIDVNMHDVSPKNDSDNTKNYWNVIVYVGSFITVLSLFVYLSTSENNRNRREERNS